MPSTWTLEYVVDVHGHSPMERFLDGLGDEKFAALDAALTHVLAVHGIALAATPWLRPLKGGLHEFRVRHSRAEIIALHQAAGEREPSPRSTGPVLLRVFVHFHGDRVCLLLGGYDKGRDTSVKRQQREIASARRLLTQWRRQQQHGGTQSWRPR